MKTTFNKRLQGKRYRIVCWAMILFTIALLWSLSKEAYEASQAFGAFIFSTVALYVSGEVVRPQGTVSKGFLKHESISETPIEIQNDSDENR